MRPHRVRPTDNDHPHTRQDMLEICIAARTPDEIERAADQVTTWLEENPHDDVVRLVRDRLVARGFVTDA